MVSDRESLLDLRAGSCDGTQQVVVIERLAEALAVGPQAHRGDLDVVVGGHENGRWRLTHGRQEAVEVVSVHSAQVDVEDEAVHLAGRGTQEFFGGGVGPDLMPGRPKEAADRPAHGIVVVHHGNPAPGCRGAARMSHPRSA